jgi:diguanylate cyclase (GGDEF)-like protein/PAS domain S-box-containing protein
VHGQYDLELPVEGPEEVRRLTQGYNSMLRALDSRIHELQFSEERFRSLVDSSPDCVLMVDLDWRVVHMSSAGLNIFRVSRSDDVIGKPLAELFPPVSRDWLANALQRARDGDAMSATVEGYGAREDERWLEIILAPVRAIDGHIASIIGRLRDVTASKAQAAALEHMTLHDMLTDLPNRGLFLERLEHALGEAQRENKSLAVIVMDLDRFKEVNDTLGHHIGDQLLQQVALRLQDTFRGEMIARLGGDEFAVYVPGATESAAIQYGQRAIKALEQPIPLSDLDIQIGTSIGITMFPPHGRTGAVLLQRADVAMYYAKRQKTGFAVYTQQIDPNSLRRLALVGELRHAIDNDELILHFQPKVDGTGRNCCGVEALVRWQHPQHGMMPPMEFIGLAEETGLIRPLTRWVLDAALRQWDKWQALGHRLPIAVNLSVRNLLDPKLAELIASQLRRWNVPPQFLQLEITESDIMSDPERALKVLRSLDQMGISLAIDDFGTGYSSLAYLKRLPVDEIKIDKSFVMNMAHDDNDALIVEATIDLAHKLGLSIVAEGVEDAATMARLHSAGCNALQGFLISRPVPADALVAWLASHTIGSAEVAR